MKTPTTSTITTLWEKRDTKMSMSFLQFSRQIFDTFPAPPPKKKNVTKDTCHQFAPPLSAVMMQWGGPMGPGSLEEAVT